MTESENSRLRLGRLLQDEEWQTAVREWTARACSHPRTELREATLKNGSKQLRHQCVTCGNLQGMAVRRTPEHSNVEQVDVNLSAAYDAARKDEFERMRSDHLSRQEKRDGSIYRDYRDYINSPEWARIRRLVLNRAHGLCEGCGESKATQVHHLHYRHFKREFLFELVALCSTCHSRLHDNSALSEDDLAKLDQALDEGPSDEFLWSDALPCLGCRMFAGYDEKKKTHWCARLDVSIKRALAISGDCGPSASLLEPLR